VKECVVRVVEVSVEVLVSDSVVDDIHTGRLTGVSKHQLKSNTALCTQ
jgi:hypothetical protein